MDLSNDFSISLAATVEFADADDNIEGIIDITDEVEAIMDVSKDGQNKFADAIAGSELWNDDDGDLEYVDIFSIPLGQIPLPVPVVSLMLEFNVVGSIGARAGLYVEFSHHYVETTTLANGEKAEGDNGKPVMFNEFKFTRATTENEIGIAVTLKGKAGFRCGLEAKLSLSILKLNSVASVYVSFRFGPYIELSGLVSFRYSYDAVNKTSETHLYGGMYLEVGLFLNAKLGAKFLVYDVNTDIFDKKIPLYGVGDRLIPLEFAESDNSPENPYVTTSRYVGVRMSTVQMRYLDIVTGDDEVYDSALRNRYGKYLDYEFELVDDPEYQTRDYDKYVTINNGNPLVSRNFPFKSLKYVIKAKLLPRHGVYASGIEKIFYVEYRNPDGRDYAVMHNEFRNEYYAGGGATHSEVLANLSFLEGEQVVPPDLTEADLPVRQGYYLDLDDLWEKYFPFLGDQIDGDFDGTFPVVTYENATQIYKGYMIVSTCYYRLKWKQRVFKAEFSAPVYLTSSEIARTEHLLSADMLYVPSLRYFVVLADYITAPDITGKKYSGFVSPSGLTFFFDYYSVDPSADAFKGFDIEGGSYPIIRVDTESTLYLEDFEGIKNGAQFVATYADENVFTETYVLETETVSRVKAEYKPFDYVGKTIRPLPPEQFEIGSEFTENGNTYVITGYRDINAENDENSRFYEASSMPDVTKNRIWYVLYERKGYKDLPVYYVKIMANGVYIGDFGIKQGEKINVDLLKINFSDEMVVSKLAGYPLHDIGEVLSGTPVVEWDLSTIPNPALMPDKDITVNLTATYTLGELTAEFIVDDPLQSFAEGVKYETRENNGKEERVHVASGKPWTFGMEDESAFYSLPALNDYFDNESKTYYSFYGWRNSVGEEYPYGVRIAFVKNETYTPVFADKKVKPTIAFVSVGDYGYEYYHKIVEGDYFGKTLKEVISEAKISDPVRGDVKGVSEYTFKGWGVDAETYIVGSEKDLSGNVKTYIVFRAQFDETAKKHTITFEAMDGEFENGEKTFKLTDVYGTDISYVRPKDYSDEKGDFSFVCWTTKPYSPEDKIDAEDMKIGGADATYYAYYSLSPATITLTFKGGYEAKYEDDADNPAKKIKTYVPVNVYFNGDKTQTELAVSDLYGRGYYLTANLFAVDDASKTYVADYLKWTYDGEEYVSAFYNDGYMAYVPFDHDATIEIFFKPATERIVNIAFVSDGECFEPDGTKIDGVTCNGYMTGFRHVANYYETYGTTMTAPYVDYYSDKYYRFDHWETKPEDGSEPVSVKQGEQITFTENTVFYGVYVHDTAVKVQLTFRADSFRENDGGDLTGIKTFADGSVEIFDYGAANEKITFDKLPSCEGLKFIGWTTDGDDLITQEQLAETVYSERTTYYAVYESAPDVFEIKLDAGDGKFADRTTEKTIANVPFGKLAAELEKPKPNADGLVFSHFKDENGYPVTAIDKSTTLYAAYAKPIYNFGQLKNVNLAPYENYVLMNDITAGGSIFDYDDLADWTALGADAKNGFSGVFNGNGYKIRITAKSGTKRNFGIFSKVSGTIYNLSVIGTFSISGSTDATTLGAFASELTAIGKIIDCHSMAEISVAVNPTNKLSVSGAIGTNNGLIDGLIASAGGQIDVDGNNEFTVGVTVGTNNGKMKNVNQSGRSDFSAVNVSLARSLDCYIGSFVGYNSGEIENCFAERPISILLSQGDNVYLKNSVRLGGFVGRNDGTITNSTTLYGTLEYSVNNITLFGEKGLYLTYNPYAETPSYTISVVGKDNQGITHTVKCVIYLEDDAAKKGSTEYEEYTLSEFREAHPAEAAKIDALRSSVAFDGFVPVNNGKTDNCFVVPAVGTGNGIELVSSCGFDGLKWNYLARLHNKIYG